MNSDILLHRYYNNDKHKVVARFGAQKGGFG